MRDSQAGVVFKLVLCSSWCCVQAGVVFKLGTTRLILIPVQKCSWGEQKAFWSFLSEVRRALCEEAGQAPVLVDEWMHSNCNMSKAKTNEEAIFCRRRPWAICNGVEDMFPLPRELGGSRHLVSRRYSWFCTLSENEIEATTYFGRQGYKV
jgi:hypothetical protein